MIAPTRSGLFALLGYPVEHSLSPAMQNSAFEAAGLDCRYSLLPTAPAELGATIERCVREGYAGWNVTVPHKERMLDYLDEASAEVAAVGACNTVIVSSGRLIGHNTDIAGFLAGLDEAGGIGPRSRAVLLGAGGGARAVAYALAKAGHNVMILARDLERAGSLAAWLGQRAGLSVDHGKLDAVTMNGALEGAGLIVNCTPAGMWPDVDVSPLPENVHLPSDLLVYDLVYRPRPTRLILEAGVSGCRTQDGLAMLVHQGAAAFEIWTGHTAPVEIMRHACLDALQAATPEAR